MVFMSRKNKWHGKHSTFMGNWGMLRCIGRKNQQRDFPAYVVPPRAGSMECNAVVCQMCQLGTLF